MRRRSNDIDGYIATFPPKVRSVLRNVRKTIRKAAPDVEEKISYGMPTVALRRNLIYYAAFKNHLGIFPPVKGDAKLAKALEPYRGPKGNLRFPLDEAMPYPLIARVVKARLEEYEREERTRAGASAKPRRARRNQKKRSRSA